MGLILEGGNRGERKDDILCGILKKKQKAVHKWTGKNRLRGKNHPDDFLLNGMRSAYNLKPKL